MSTSTSMKSEEEMFKVVLEVYHKQRGSNVASICVATRESCHPIGVFASAETAKPVVEEILLSVPFAVEYDDIDRLVWDDFDTGKEEALELCGVRAAAARVSEVGARIAAEGGSLPGMKVTVCKVFDHLGNFVEFSDDDNNADDVDDHSFDDDDDDDSYDDDNSNDNDDSYDDDNSNTDDDDSDTDGDYSDIDDDSDDGSDDDDDSDNNNRACTLLSVAKNLRKANLITGRTEGWGEEVEELLETVVHDGGASVAVCFICLKEVPAGTEVIRLPCKDWFHGYCIRLWLAVEDGCPRCWLNLLALTRCWNP